MTAAEQIRQLRAQTNLNRSQFSRKLGIPLRTMEDWEAGRRTPPEYVPRLIGYALKYEELVHKLEKEQKKKQGQEYE